MDPEDLRAACPACGHQLWQRRQGEWTLSNRILKLRSIGDIVAKCPGCGGDVPVPFLRIQQPRRRRRLVVSLDSTT